MLSEVTLLNNANDIAIDSSSSDTGSSSNSDDDDFNPEFIENMVQNKLDWNALVMASHSLGIAELPLQMPESLSQDLLRTLHTVLIKVLCTL